MVKVSAANISIRALPGKAGITKKGILFLVRGGSDALYAKMHLNEPEFKFALNRYLEQPGSHVPVHSLQEIIASGKYDKPALERFLSIAESYEDGPNSADYKDRQRMISNDCVAEDAVGYKLFSGSISLLTGKNAGKIAS